MHACVFASRFFICTLGIIVCTSYTACPGSLCHGALPYTCFCLLLQLEALNNDKARMHREKVDLENQLEAEQEYIMNKLHKQVRDKSHCRQLTGSVWISIPGLCFNSL